MPQRSQSTRRRFIATLLLVTLVFGFVAMRPKPAAALFGVGDVVSVIGDIPATIANAATKAYNFLKDKLKFVGDINFKNSLRQFAARLTQTIATQLATAGPGQKPLFLTNPTTFFTDVRDAAETQFLDDFTKGLTGGALHGKPGTSARTKFIISRFLRSAVGSPLQQCRDDCNTTLGVRSAGAYELTAAPPQNDHETRIADILDYLKKPGGTEELAATAPKTPMVCRDVELPGPPFNPVWRINVGNPSPPTLPASDCLNAQHQAILTEKSSSQEETNSCLSGCQNGVANLATQAVNKATQTDVFASVAGLDVQNASAGIANALSKDKSDIGQLLQTSAALTAVINSKITGQQTLLNAGALPRTSKVSDTVLASKDVTTGAINALFTSGTTGESTYTGTSFADILKGILSFINSPIGKALHNAFISKCGFNPDACRGPSNASSPLGQLLFGSGGPTGIQGAELQFSALGQTEFLTGDPGKNQIDVTNQLTSSGLIDPQFQTAIDETLTVQEALNKKMLDPNKSFGFDKNGNQPTSGYPFRALQYLRKFRVTPVGWELAAKYYQQYDRFENGTCITGQNKGQKCTSGTDCTVGNIEGICRPAMSLSLGYLVKQFDMCGQDPQHDANPGGNTCVSGPKPPDTKCTTSNDCTEAGVCGTSNTCTSGPKVGTPCATDLECSNVGICGPAFCDTTGNACTTNAECGGGVCQTRYGASPYCGLVDPNWVLKAPQSFCRRQGAGEEIVTKEFICDQNNVDRQTGAAIASDKNPPEDDPGPANCVRSDPNPFPDIGRWVINRNTDSCADTQSCIAENDDGTCLAYGYCMQERQTFKFDGQQCDVQNGTCTTYTDSGGTNQTYLANTLDFRNCSADVAGCQWYCTDADPKGNWTCTDSKPDNKQYMTAQAKTCSSTAVGCHEFVRTTNGTNILPNGGFEYFTGDIDSPIPTDFAGWSKSVPTIQTFAVSADDPDITANNKAAAKIVSTAPSDALSQSVNSGYPLFERSFTASIRAKADSDCSATLTLQSDAGSPSATMTVTTGWQTFATTLTVPPEGTVPSVSNMLTFVLKVGSCAGTNLTVDSAQLEENPAATSFRDYGTVNQIDMTKDRQACKPADVGCEAYTPLAGGSKVNAVARNSNRCTADKVGCATYGLAPITRVPQRSGTGSSCTVSSDCPTGSTCTAGKCSTVNVVPPKAKTCTAADVGCEEYTNLDVAKQGGEAREYYKQIKQCVKPTNTKVTTNPYYTWVGDPAKGFVLRAYTLVQTNLNIPKYAGAPCTNLEVGTTVADPACKDTTATADAATCKPEEMATNPDCTEYYDSKFDVFYRLRSRTVTVTDNCHPYRNTIDDQAARNLVYYLAPTENLACSAAAAGCRAYTGNGSNTTKQVFSENFNSGTTTNWSGGTPSTASVHVGGYSMNIPIVGSNGAAYTSSLVKNQLSQGKTYILSFIAAADQVSKCISGPKIGTQCSANSECTVGPTVGVCGLPVITAAFGRRAATGDFQPDRTFPGSATVKYNTNITPAGPEWNAYTVGPVALDIDPAAVPDPGMLLGIMIKNGSVDIDNIVLTEVNDSLYLIGPTVPQCAADEVGCAAYRDRAGKTQYLKSFTRICSEQVVGCEALIDTQNSNSPFAETVRNVTTPADAVVTVVNDSKEYCQAAFKGCQAFGKPVFSVDQKLTNYRTVYLLNNPDTYSTALCLPEESYCQAFTIPGGGSAFFKSPGNRTCEFRGDATNGGQWYITGTQFFCPTVVPPAVGRPVGASCSPVCLGGDRDGRPCTDTTTSSDCSGGKCIGDLATAGKINSLGTTVVGQCKTDADCLGNNKCVYLAGVCPAEQNGCTEYRDPTDPSGCRSECPLVLQGGSPTYMDATCTATVCNKGANIGQNCQTDGQCPGGQCVGTGGTPVTGIPGCRSYFYIRSTVEDNAAECNGQVNTKIGCRPFYDTSKPDVNYKSF